MRIQFLKAGFGEESVEQPQSRVDGFIALTANFAYDRFFAFGYFHFFFRLIGKQQIEFMKIDKAQDIGYFCRKENRIHFVGVRTHTHEQRI